MGCGASSQASSGGDAKPQQQVLVVKKMDQASTGEGTMTAASSPIIGPQTLTQLLIVLVQPEPSKNKVQEVIEGACGEDSAAASAVTKLRSVAPENTAMIAATAFTWMGTVAPPPFNTVLGLMGKIFCAAGMAQHNRRMANYLAMRLLSINEPLSEALGRGDYKNPSDSDVKLAARIRNVLEECHLHLQEFLPPSDEDSSAIVEWAKVKVKEITTSQEQWDLLHNKIDQLLRDITFDHVVKGRLEAAETARMLREDAEDVKAMLKDLRVDIDKLQEETGKLVSMTTQLLKQQEFEDMLVDASQVRLIRPVGEGGQGVIWEALLDNKPTVVAKQVNSTNHVKAMDALREAKMLMKFRHPNIVQCFGVCVKANETYVLLERCVESMDRFAVPPPSGTVEKSSATFTRVPIAAALTPLYDISCALAHVHSRCNVHRDIKVDNAMVKANGDVCIIDFGSMKSDAGKKSNMHTTMAMAGLEGTTALYAAPELLQDPMFKATGACDVYSFGMVMYEVTHGTRAFEAERKGMSQAKLMARIEDGMRPALDAALPEDLRELIKQCWESAPEDRPKMEYVKRRIEDIKRLHYSDSESQWKAYLQDRWNVLGRSIQLDPSAASLTRTIPSLLAVDEGAAESTSRSIAGPLPATAEQPATPPSVQPSEQLVERCPLDCCERVFSICKTEMEAANLAKLTPDALCKKLLVCLGLTVAPLRLKHFLTLRGKGVEHLDADHLRATICDFTFWFVVNKYNEVAKGKASLSTEEAKRIITLLVPQTLEALKDELDAVLEDVSLNGQVSMNAFFSTLDTLFTETLETVENAAATGASQQEPSSSPKTKKPSAPAGAAALIHDMVYEIVPAHDESFRVEVPTCNPSEIKNATRFRIAATDGTSAQRFVAKDNSDGTWSFFVACAQGFVLDNGGSVGAACHAWESVLAHPNQSWQLQRSPDAPAGDYWFILRSKMSPENVLQVGGGLGATLTTGAPRGALEQSFKFVRVSNAAVSHVMSGRLYEIAPRSVPSHRLTLSGEACDNGTKFVFQEQSAALESRQKFRAHVNNDGSWAFFPCCAPWAVVDNAGGPNRVCHLYSSVPSHVNQSWFLQPVNTAVSSAEDDVALIVRSKLDRTSVWSADTSGSTSEYLLNLHCMSTANQHMVFTATSCSAIEGATALKNGGLYEIMPQHNTSLRVTVQNGGVANGTPLLLKQRSGAAAQQFKARWVHESHAWTFLAACTDGASTIDSSGADNKPCHLYKDTAGVTNQRWHLQSADTSGQWFYVRSETHGGMLWDVSGSGGDGAQLLNWSFHGGPNQKFKFVSAEDPNAQTNSSGNKATLSTKTNKFYCGQALGFACGCCDGKCGPTSGCNCIPCQLLDQESRGIKRGDAVVNREGAVSKWGSVRGAKLYCGRNNMRHDPGTDGYCGPGNGNNCKACQIALKTYASLLN